MPHSIFLDGMGRRAQDGKFAEFPPEQSKGWG